MFFKVWEQIRFCTHTKTLYLKEPGRIFHIHLFIFCHSWHLHFWIMFFAKDHTGTWTGEVTFNMKTHSILLIISFLILQFECTSCLLWWESLTGRHHNRKRLMGLSMLQQKKVKGLIPTAAATPSDCEFMNYGCLDYTCKFEVTLLLGTDWKSLNTCV